MTLYELIQNNRFFKESPLLDPKLGDKNVVDIKPLDLARYQAYVASETDHQTAEQHIDQLQKQTVTALIKSQVSMSEVSYLTYSLDKSHQSHNFFLQSIYASKISDTRKSAIIFALEVYDDLHEVIQVTRKQASSVPHTTISHRLMKNCIPSLQTKYLFWEVFETFGITGPLIGLQQDFDYIFSGMTFKTIKALYKHSATMNG